MKSFNIDFVRNCSLRSLLDVISDVFVISFRYEDGQVGDEGINTETDQYKNAIIKAVVDYRS